MKYCLDSTKYVSYLGFSRACGSSRARPAGFFSASSWVSNSSSASTLPCVRIATKKDNVSQYFDIHDEYQGQNADKVNQLSITFSFYGVISRNYFIALEILVYYDLTSVSVQFKAILI